MPYKCEHIPSDLNEAVDVLFVSLDENEISYIKEHGVVGMHHGFGTYLRNSWGLWHDSVLAQYFKRTYGLGHADDMSGLILTALEQKVNDHPIDLESEIEFYKNHWRMMRIDPLTQTKL